MARRFPTDRLDDDLDERLTFADVTMLAFLAVSTLALMVVVLLGTVSAIHRIATVVERL